MYNQDFQNHLTQLDNITAISMSKNTNPFEAMSNVTDCNELHLMAHGSPGNLDLGSGIDTQALYENAEYLSMLNVQKIILWGCNVGKDTKFIKTFSNLTNSAVYASKDYVGKNKGMSDEFPEMNDFIKSLPFQLAPAGSTFTVLRKTGVGTGGFDLAAAAALPVTMDAEFYYQPGAWPNSSQIY